MENFIISICCALGFVIYYIISIVVDIWIITMLLSCHWSLRVLFLIFGTMCKLAVLYYLLDITIIQYDDYTIYRLQFLQLCISVYSNFIYFVAFFKHFKLKMIWLLVALASILLSVACVVYTIVDHFQVPRAFPKIMQEARAQAQAQAQAQTQALKVAGQADSKDDYELMERLRKSHTHHYRHHHNSIFIINIILVLFVNCGMGLTLVTNRVLQIINIFFVAHAIIFFCPLFYETTKKIFTMNVRQEITKAYMTAQQAKINLSRAQAIPLPKTSVGRSTTKTE